MRDTVSSSDGCQLTGNLVNFLNKVNEGEIISFVEISAPSLEYHLTMNAAFAVAIKFVATSEIKNWMMNWSMNTSSIVISVCECLCVI